MKTVLMLSAFFLLGGCAIFQNDAQRSYAMVGRAIGKSNGVIFTTADVRLVMRRQNPVTGEMVTCTEPTPDVAAALSTAMQIAVQGGDKAANGQIGLTGGSAEAVTELAGRTTALLALRDGLYRTCEAYANGVLGSNSYAMVLARYGQLMTTLFLGQDIAGAAGQSAARSPASASSPPLVNIGDQGAGTPPSTGTAGSKGSTTGGSTSTASGGGTLPDPPGAAGETNSPTPGGSSVVHAESNPSNDAAPTGPLNRVSKGQKTSASQPPGTAYVAESLVRMNEDYFNLDRNLVQLMVVACINQEDPTGLAFWLPDPWLQHFCKKMDTWPEILKAERQADRTELRIDHPAANVDPSRIGRTQQEATQGGTSQSTSASAREASVGAAEKVQLVQAILQADGYTVAGITGVLDTGTTEAIEHYEENNGLPVKATLNKVLLHRVTNDVRVILGGQN